MEREEAKEILKAVKEIEAGGLNGPDSDPDCVFHGKDEDYLGDITYQAVMKIKEIAER